MTFPSVVARGPDASYLQSLTPVASIVMPLRTSDAHHMPRTRKPDPGLRASLAIIAFVPTLDIKQPGV